jgi:hypothetical protein
MLKIPKQKTVAPLQPQSYAVDVISPDGTFGTVPSNEVAQAVESGYQIDSPEARKELELQQKYGEGFGNELAATGLGAARGLTFGLSDLVLAKTGAVEAKTLNEIKERNPDASMLGEFGSFVVPFAGAALGAVRGAGTVVKGAGLAARVAGSGISGVSSLGSAISRAAVKATGSELVGSAAQIAAESFAYNIAKNVSENVLGERELTAQRLLANSGTALALGAGLGLGAPLAAKGVKIAAQKAKESISSLGTAIKDGLPKLSDTLARGYADAYGAVTGKGKGAADEVFGVLEGGFNQATGKPFERSEIIKAISPEANDELIRTFTSQLDDANRAANDMVKRGFKEFRPVEVETLLKDVDPRAALEDAGRLIGTLRTTAEKIAADPVRYKQVYAGELTRLADSLEKGAALNTTEDVYRAINEAKKSQLWDLRRPKPQGDRDVQNAIAEIQNVYSEFATHLENPALYGDAGARQSGINAAFSEWKKLFSKKEKDGGAFKRFWLNEHDQVDVTKVRTQLRKIATAGDKDAVEALDRFVSASTSMVEQVEKSAINAGAKDFDKTGFNSIVKKLVDAQTKTANDLAYTNKIRQLDAFGTAFARIQEEVGGAFGGGGVFNATIKLAQKAASPFGAMKTLSTVEGLVMNTAGRATESVGRFVSRAGGAAGKVAAKTRPYAEPASLAILLGAVFAEDDDEKPRGRRDGFAKASTKLGKLAADPAGTSAKLAEGVQSLAPHAPELANAVVETQLRSIAFLNEKAPRNPDMGKTLNPFIQAWEPSDGELAQFERYAAAVQDPIGVLDELESGSVSSEAVEALKAVYPALYEDVRTQLLERVSEIETVVPYRDRIQLSIMFGVDLDPSMDNAFANAVQNSYGSASQAQEPRPAYRPTSASSKLGALEETQAQRISRR